MSSLTVETISVIARRRLGTEASDSLRFEPLVAQALISLSRKVARRDDLHELRKEIDVNCVNGIITLTDIQILLEMLDKTGVLILNDQETQWKERYDDLRATLPKDTYYAALRNRQIHVKSITTGNLNDANVTGTLDASYTPSLNQLPPAYDEELLDEVVKLAKGGTQSSALSIQGAEDVPDVRISNKGD